MARKHFKAEEIINKLREAEIEQSRGLDIHARILFLRGVIAQRRFIDARMAHRHGDIIRKRRQDSQRHEGEQTASDNHPRRHDGYLICTAIWDSICNVTG